jgi:hypothetical protein
MEHKRYSFGQNMKKTEGADQLECDKSQRDRIFSAEYPGSVPGITRVDRTYRRIEEYGGSNCLEQTG